jgi:diadenosine tetraphosphate (Ap4A) HIT family hydrolase
LRLVLCSSVATLALLSAATGKADVEKVRVRVPAVSRPLGVAEVSRAGEKVAGSDRLALRKLMKEHAERRQASLLSRAEFFKKIAVARDYSGEHVVYRDPSVTAFLDLSDPLHPNHERLGRAEDGESEARAANPNRAHLLVIPNAPREHIGRKLSGTVDSDDLEATLAVVKKAEGLAKSLGIRNPSVFVNTQDRLSVGYLHAHIVGERSLPYPNPLPSLKSDEANGAR